MKKLAILSPLVILMASTSLAQDSCIVRPSCADMGYTKTVSDCSGKTTLKCPFDLTKVSCEDDTQTTDNKLIDYDAVIPNTSLSHVSYRDNYGRFYEAAIAPYDGCFLGRTTVNPWIVTEFKGEVLSTTQACVKKGDLAEYASFFYFAPYVGSGKIKSASNCEIGDFYFSDNTCSSTSHVEKTKVGIVIDTSKRLLVSPSLYYSLRTSGHYNKDVTWSYAVDYCNNMTRGNKSWYLPSGQELKSYLSFLSARVFFYEFYFWTSTESSSKAQICNTYDGCYLDYKSNSYGENTDDKYSAVCFANY
ncbi:MAG: hypothetical protein IJV97_00705 [Alphaproteobacteria bacterium]|nr:hypothetical protein [Alphaproteobacteria bacterium]